MHVLTGRSQLEVEDLIAAPKVAKMCNCGDRPGSPVKPSTESVDMLPASVTTRPLPVQSSAAPSAAAATRDQAAQVASSSATDFSIAAIMAAPDRRHASRKHFKPGMFLFIFNLS